VLLVVLLLVTRPSTPAEATPLQDLLTAVLDIRRAQSAMPEVVAAAGGLYWSPTGVCVLACARTCGDVFRRYEASRYFLGFRDAS
jgi:hypothetical protein